jgi:asparagine synthase (glutamine-hydrolysing)
MSVGFTILFHKGGSAVCRLSRPDGGTARAALVSWAQDEPSQTAAALVGRLYYQDELRARLPEAPQDGAPDAALALAAYRHGAIQEMQRLEGEFALVIWDGKRRRLLAHRDPFGSYPLFWTTAGSTVAVSTSPEALVRLQPERRYDLDYLAEFLMRPSPVSEVTGERTVFAGVQRVPAGTTVELGADGSVGRHCYWDWASRIEAPSVNTLEEAGERFALLLRQAVRQRVQRGPVTAHLSGGMDSSAVVALARECASQGAGPAPLSALSLVYDRPSLAGERDYIDLVVRQGGPLEVHYLPADAALDYQWFERPVPFHDEPYGGLAGLAMEQLLLDGADRLGPATVLTGLGSDEILETGPFHIADLLRRGRWVAALKEVVRCSGAWNMGFWSVLRQFGLEPLWPVAMRDGLRAAWRGSGRWPDLGRFTVPPWVPPDFARKHHMRRHGKMYARRWYGRPTARSTSLNAIETFVGSPSAWYFAAPRGIHVSHPFRDPRLACFALGIPAPLKLILGRRKPVLQEATRGVLPEAIRTRREKRGFNDVYWRGLAGSMPQLERLVRTSALPELGVLDAEQLVQAMRQAALGVGDLTACERIDKTLALVAWFAQARHTRQPVEPSEVHPLGRPHRQLACSPGNPC